MPEFYTWGELVAATAPLVYKKHKDKTFSHHDIIRFFENNLTAIEQEYVIEYFKQFCEQEIKPTEELEPPIEVPQLPPPSTPMLPTIPPFIPPPETQTPVIPAPVIQLLPVLPIIIPSVSPEIIDLILPSEAEAADLEIEIEDIEKKTK